ncbi:MAG: GntR family transcriptional regulator [Sphaerochaetaceae bacterium]|nr:GntR family transcriptional regulator [Sphaerochaetaceae bacterium]
MENLSDNIETGKQPERQVKNIYKSVQRIVFETLKDEVLTGQLKPGDFLNTLTIARRLGVSRTPVREALNRLTSIGLTENEPHKGYFVKKLSVDEILEIYYIRASLSGACTRLAVNNITDEQIGHLSSLCDEMENHLSQNNHEHMLDTNYTFHDTIFKAAHSPRLQELVLQYYQLSEQYRALALELPGRYGEVCSEHRAIVDALKKRDPDLAENKEKEHQINTARRIAEALNVTPTR